VLDRSFDAAVLTWHAGTGADAAPARPAARAALVRRVQALCGAAVRVAVLGGADVPGLDDESATWPAGPGGMLLCCRDDEADVMPAALEWLRRSGLGPGLVLVVGDRFGPVGGAAGHDAGLLVPEASRACVVSVGPEPSGTPEGVLHLRGGPAMLRRLLDEQLRRRRQRRVPAVDDDPTWTITEGGRDPLRRRVTETLFTLGAGGLATRGSVEEALPGSVPLVLASGVYAGAGADQHLLAGPDWTGLSIDPPPVEDRRVLDLRSGLLWREARRDEQSEAPVRTVRFASIVRPGLVALRAEGPVEELTQGPSFRAPTHGQMSGGRLEGRRWARVLEKDSPGAGRDQGGIVAAASGHTRRRSVLRTVERIAAYVWSSSTLPSAQEAMTALDAAAERGFDRLLVEHREAWVNRWQAVDVSIPADPQAQLAVRFALFQLWNNVDRPDEAAVGARGLSGTGYSGHVFWDADVFVLPAIASMSPAVARAIIEYRLRRLPAARALARDSGRAGARYPWESAANGRDVTPPSGYLGGQAVPILTGRMEEHITADVAWAACHYASWTGDDAFLRGPGRDLLAETARYWASRSRVDRNGSAHIDGVIGPDEYHEAVNDNAFTNVMARWNLRRAADLMDTGPGPTAETRRWRDIADRLVDGYHPATGRYEQFAGYDGLEPLLISDITEPPVAADVLLGRSRIAHSQVIKQPDVLMLHHLVPDEVESGSLAPNVDFYAPRTAHGSSLSPAIMAALLGRAGRADEALRLLRIALVLDLEDESEMTATGLHLATMGGVWQAMLAGFAGVRVRAGVLHVDPVLPTSWPRLGLRFRCLDRHVRLDITPEDVEIRVDAPLRVNVCGAETRDVRDTMRVTCRTAGDAGGSPARRHLE
jgi:trehalose/maltose hydrolase-like predicted phosphorylase